MKHRIIALFIVLIILVSGCTAKKEVPGEKDRPSKKVPQTDEFNDPYGSDEKRKKSIDENDDLIGE